MTLRINKFCIFFFSLLLKICWLPIGDFCQNFSHQIYFFTFHGNQMVAGYKETLQRNLVTFPNNCRNSSSWNKKLHKNWLSSWEKFWKSLREGISSEKCAQQWYYFGCVHISLQGNKLKIPSQFLVRPSSTYAKPFQHIVLKFGE